MASFSPGAPTSRWTALVGLVAGVRSHGSPSARSRSAGRSSPPLAVAACGTAAAGACSLDGLLFAPAAATRERDHAGDRELRRRAGAAQPAPVRLRRRCRNITAARSRSRCRLVPRDVLGGLRVTPDQLFVLALTAGRGRRAAPLPDAHHARPGDARDLAQPAARRGRRHRRRARDPRHLDDRRRRSRRWPGCSPGLTVQLRPHAGPRPAAAAVRRGDPRRHRQRLRARCSAGSSSAWPRASRCRSSAPSTAPRSPSWC